MIEKLKIEDAKLCSKNFSGAKSKYKAAGTRRFSLILDQDIAEKLIDEGWNVSVQPPKEDGDSTRYYLDVAVKFEKYPPVVKLVTSRGITQLDADTVGQLDQANIINADIVVTPYHWHFNNDEGIKAYLKTGYFTIEEDEFAAKYDTI